jgi:hypothetical protein
MMNYFIKINESIFGISQTFAGLLEKDFITVYKEIQDKRQTFVLDDPMLSSFQVVDSTPQTQSYKLRYGSSWCGIHCIEDIFKEKRFGKGDEEQNCHDCRIVAK